MTLAYANRICNSLYGSNYCIRDSSENCTGGYSFDYCRFSDDGILTFAMIRHARSLRDLLWKIHPECNGKRSYNELIFNVNYILTRKASNVPCQTITIYTAEKSITFDKTGRKYTW